VHPKQRGDEASADRYRQILLHASHIDIVPVSEWIAEEAAGLRARHNMRTPDAIQLATAVRSGASVFLTNDSHLRALGSLKILVLDQLIAARP